MERRQVDEQQHRTLYFQRKKMTNNNSSFASNYANSTRVSSPRANGSLKNVSPGTDDGGGKSDDEKLKERGISIAESSLRNFSNISPIEVTDYYKGLGDWQEVLPKTDYAYSPMSAYNKMKINGVYPVIPNMSRRHLWSDHYKNVNVTEVRDNEKNSFYAKKYSAMENSSTTTTTTTTRRWHLRKSSYQDDHRFEPASYSSGSGTKSSFRQWISSKRSSLSQFSSKIYRRWHSYSTRTAEAFLSSSSARSSWHKILVQNVFPFLLLLFLILYLFPWSHRLSTFSSSLSSTPVIDYLYNFCVLVYKLVESFFSLVYHIVDITLASVTFTLSCISWPREFSFTTIPNYVFAPLYQDFRTYVTRTPENEQQATKTAVHLDDSQIEQLFRRLMDASSSEFTRKVASSREFSDLVDKKLNEFREEQRRVHEKLADGNANVEERLRMLETLVSAHATNATEQIRQLREEVLQLREEIRSKETKIQNDFFVLLSTVLQTEPGGGGDEATNFDALKAKFVSIFRSVEEAHFKVDKLNREFLNYVNNASERVEIVIERSRERVKQDLRATIEELAARKLDEWKRTTTTSDYVVGEDAKTLERYVKKIVQQALDVYDADKTGMADYALESSGGIVLSTRCTETKKSHAQFSILGIPFWQTSTSPRTVIQPGVHPGECWAFPGQTGYLVVQLSQRIYVTGVTLEHIPKAIAVNGTIDSAPKDFSVWALRSETDPEAKFLGKFRYDENGPSVQQYEVVPLDQPYQIVELKILSNHGRIDYTCLYRFRVHGIPV